MLEDLKKYIEENYNINVIDIEKNTASTEGNVYIIKNEYVVKVYEDLYHVKNMIELHRLLELKNIYAPKIIKTKTNNSYINFISGKYIVIYSFILGNEISELDNNIICNIANLLRKLHNETLNNKLNLSSINFINNKNIKRKSILHFDITRHNVFNNNAEIIFIDFDDAKYGESVIDVAIAITNLFFSKKRCVNKQGINIFIDEYYKDDIENKIIELPLIKSIAIKWINYVLSGHEFDASTFESFNIKKKLIEENLD